MCSRGIDQILPHPSRPELFEPYVRSAHDYVDWPSAPVDRSRGPRISGTSGAPPSPNWSTGGIEAYPIRVAAETPVRARPQTVAPEPQSPGGYLHAFVRRVPPLRALGRWIGRGLETILAVAREPAFLWRSPTGAS